ncbi:MAG: DUF2961 domain-containing protein [Candidatus Hydrogenedentes bacterium]|nr:DUF2961 domain-containing protein [Candidatus Hydrogenedentota bacterium]
MRRIIHAISAVAIVLCAASACADGGLLDSLPALKSYHAGRYSSFDPSGGNADGRHDMPLKPGETRVLADIEGAGAITHIWTTIATYDEKHLKNMVIRMYWDGEQAPSVEAPVGDFFGLGHGRYYQYACLPIQIGTDKGLNCFWRMPFNSGAKITVTNEGTVEGEAFYYYVDYQILDRVGDEVGRVHAQYRQAFPAPPGQNYIFFEARGRGHYVGCNLSLHLRAGGWWGEGDDMIYVDDDTEPTLHGTGAEDYFCGAWAYGINPALPFANPYFGAPYIQGDHTQNALWNVYRYHLEDPIPFTESIRVTIEHGHANNRDDDYSSVAYWYQTEPHAPFPPLPKPEDRFPDEATVFVQPYAFEAEPLVPLFQSEDVVAQDMAEHGNEWSKGQQLLFKADGPKTYSAILPTYASDAADYTVDWWYTTGPDYGQCELWLNGEKVAAWDGYSAKGPQRQKLNPPAPTTVKPADNKFEVRVVGKNEKSTGYHVGLDCYLANPK